MRGRAAIVAVAFVAVGCSDASVPGADQSLGPPMPESTLSADTTERGNADAPSIAAPEHPWPLAVFDYEHWEAQPGWGLQEAVYPLEGQWPSVLMETMEWFNEYDRLVDIGEGVREGFHLNVAGHSAGFGYFQALPIYPDLATTEPINGHPALSSINADGEGYVTIMLMVDEEFTLVVGAGAMTLDEVRQIASRVWLVDADEWQAHGGQFIECVWLAPDCDAIPPKYQTTTTTVRPSTELATTTLGPD